MFIDTCNVYSSGNLDIMPWGKKKAFRISDIVEKLKRNVRRNSEVLSIYFHDS